jgi:hypothetical protein
MLIIVMHNNKKYLEELKTLAKKGGIENFSIVEDESLGVLSRGATSDVIIFQSSMVNVYDKSFLAVVEDNKKGKRFLEMIEKDINLQSANRDQEGFICAVPFNHIKYLQMRNNCSEKEGEKNENN